MTDNYKYTYKYTTSNQSNNNQPCIIVLFFNSVYSFQKYQSMLLSK